MEAIDGYKKDRRRQQKRDVQHRQNRRKQAQGNTSPLRPKEAFEKSRKTTTNRGSGNKKLSSWPPHRLKNPGKHQRTAAAFAEHLFFADLKFNRQETRLFLLGDRLQDQPFELFEQMPLIGAHQTEVADFDKTMRQDMLQISSDKLHHIQVAGFSFFGLVIFIGKRNRLIVMERQVTMIRHRRSKDVRRDILNHFPPVACRFTVNHPVSDSRLFPELANRVPDIFSPAPV